MTADQPERTPAEELHDILTGPRNAEPVAAVADPVDDGRPHGDIAQGPRGEPPTASAAQQFADFVQGRRQR